MKRVIKPEIVVSGAKTYPAGIFMTTNKSRGTFSTFWAIYWHENYAIMKNSFDIVTVCSISNFFFNVFYVLFSETCSYHWRWKKSFHHEIRNITGPFLHHKITYIISFEHKVRYVPSSHHKVRNIISFKHEIVKFVS